MKTTSFYAFLPFNRLDLPIKFKLPVNLIVLYSLLSFLAILPSSLYSQTCSCQFRHVEGNDSWVTEADCSFVVCPGDLLRMRGPSGTGYTWTDSGGNVVRTQRVFNLSTNIPGVYVYNLVVDDNCTGTFTATVMGADISVQEITCGGGNDGGFTISNPLGTGPFTYSIDGTNFQSSPTFTGLSAGTYSIQMNDTEEGLICDINEVVLTDPILEAHAISPSCTDGNANVDGYLLVTNAVGDKFHYSEGGTFNAGSNTYANASNLTSPLPMQIVTGLSNPTGTQDYTIRIYNGANDCFTDITVIMQEQDCTVGCDCTEYVYINEPNMSEVHKFAVNPTDGSLTEIFTDGGSWYPGANTSELNSPHGIATDLNGFLYIAEANISSSANTNPSIRKLTCDGEIFPESEFNIPLVGVTNLNSIGNLLITQRGLVYDACSGQNVFNEPCAVDENGAPFANDSTGGVFNWGTSLGINDTIYSIKNADNGYIYKYTLEELMNSNTTGNCLEPFIVGTAANPLNSETSMLGLAVDMAGNIYQVDARLGFEAKICKYDASGNFVTCTPLDDNNGDGGWYAAAGLVYSMDCNCLYTVNNTEVDDCVSSFDLDLNYLGAAVGPVGGDPSNNTGSIKSKAAGIIKECCPTSNNMTIDSLICVDNALEPIYLQELFNCEGGICEGNWTPDAGNTGLIFDPCNNSVMLDATSVGCGSFVLMGDGMGNNPQCGAFVITVNIEIVNNPTVTLLPDSTICEGESIMLYGILDSPGTPDYQWQISTTSCTTAAFTDISGATDSTYVATPTSTTFYRLITTSIGNCASGNCADTSACVSISVNSLPTALPSPSIVCLNTIDTILGNPSGGSGVYSNHTWIDQTDGSASGYTLNFTNNEKLPIDASTATAGTINLKYVIVDDAGCFDTISHTVMITEPETVVICEDTTNHAELIAQSGLTNVVWYNGDDVQVATGDTLFLDAATPGMSDGMDTFYYLAEDVSGCDAGLCCPIVVTTENCCKPDICLPFTVTIKRGQRN